ncbi:hypothetical protein EII17_04335 [Clostridiales bacterium COT073_COT-073]|nr:hypothetical protein EII17_04335 [Clostridiales bacterium COT073_COT-073]
MEYAIKILEKERELIVTALKNGENEHLTALKELDKALDWLRLLKEKQLGAAKKYNVETLPFIEGRGGFSSYRIAIDNETDDIKFWNEYKKMDGSHLLLFPGDCIFNER